MAKKYSKLLKNPDVEETGYCGDCIHCRGIDEDNDVCICELDNPHKDWRFNDNEPCCDWDHRRKYEKELEEKV